jgi:hypothetical protein
MTLAADGGTGGLVRDLVKMVKLRPRWRRRRVLLTISRRLRTFYDFLRMTYASGASELLMGAEQHAGNSQSQPGVLPN